ncbi:tRNA glutamyl-Q(34) synthetase GluQRS [uncultured Desulfovibrio sp.]|uniref:tRNA glutamyl-Q(34) synthetase GluQRS n=2 Tax=uncultured Desulfovibrio sp. TaxID=167968 RepID=UPI0026228922|nr:tRNA glutamyl-Q(34) synthetase GluQRS [uncultured Desulfovibrio sp.]
MPPRGEEGTARICGRLAPSPTGYVHLGNAWAFLLAWLAARARKGVLVLRLEDIDPQRSRPEFAAALLQDLRWLGLDWDQGPDVGGPLGPYEQSRRASAYAQALARLEAAGLTYPCFCTRKELRLLAAAPHVDDAGAPYPGTCRQLSAMQREALFRSGRKAAVRLRCPDASVAFEDALLGPQSFRLAECGGDFALRRSDGVVAYQLAVAVDDALMGVNQVVRGRDILPSTPRQIALLRLLGHDAPAYAHIPLLLDGEGQRLAKRHQSLALRALRERGASARRIVGLLSRLAGLNPRGLPVSPAELLPDFSLERLPGADQRVTERDLRQLAL